MYKSIRQRLDKKLGQLKIIEMYQVSDSERIYHTILLRPFKLLFSFQAGLENQENMPVLSSVTTYKTFYYFF